MLKVRRSRINKKMELLAKTQETAHNPAHRTFPLSSAKPLRKLFWEFHRSLPLENTDK